MNNYSILLTDDDPYILSSLGKKFKKNGFKVQIADSGESAIELLGLTSFDLVVTDLVMDGIGGIDVLKKVKSIAPETMVMIMTGFGEMTSAVEALRFGADDYLLKSSEPGEIIHRVSRCLEKLDLKKSIKAKSDELVKVNRELQKEIEIRKEKEDQLLQAHEELEEKVKERTADLGEANIALKVLLKKRDEDKRELEQRLVANVKDQILPYVHKITNINHLSDKEKTYVDIIESNLDDIISPFINSLSSKHSKFTPSEIQVANLVKDGKTTKEIAELLNSSGFAVDFHRKNIRKKLDLKYKDNLRSHLLSLAE